jgi:predicted RNA binding protein YcfA (HicA-like mRNA interferase family)
MKTKELIRCLCRSPLYYKIIRQKGSHRTLLSDNYPMIRISYHGTFEISGFKVRQILINDIGLSESVAKQVIA